MTTIVHHPAAHPFVENLWGPAPPSPPVWEATALTAEGVRLVHLHFGFEQRSAADLARWVDGLHDAGIAVVHTVHDLDNPHLVVQAEFHRSVATLVRAVDAVTTLTPAAAAAVERRTGRAPVVIPHPHVVPLAEMSAVRLRRGGRHGIYVHAGAGRPNLDVDAVARLATSQRRHAVLVHVRPSAPPSTQRVLERLARAGRLHLDVRPRLTDAELWSRLAAAELLLLPYRWGTHSGLLEAAHDLGTPVLASSCGAYRDQGAHTYRDDPSGEVAAAIASRPAVTVASRRRERRLARARFASVHDGALRSASGAA
ncbi:MAG TPA: hypothetical protein VFT09_12910 [Ilumatobacteraceae bacterium]|nr:hypothetical protein [Ilumatobacteraceae bacterium]